MNDSKQRIMATETKAKRKSFKKKWLGLPGRIFSIIMVLALVSGLPVLQSPGSQVYAAENTDIKIIQSGGYFAVVGESGVNLTMRVENKGNSPLTFTSKTSLSQNTGVIMEPKPSTAKITLEAGEAAEVLFILDVAKTAKADDYIIPVILADAKDGSVLRSGNLELRVIKKSLSPGASGDNISYSPAFDLVHKLSPSDAIKSGSITKLTLDFVNSGNTIMKNALVTLEMPEGVTINNGSNSLSVGYVNIGDAKSLSFSLAAEDKVETKNYPFTVEIQFKDHSNSEQSLKQTIYIPVQGSGKTSSLSGLSIKDINIPRQVLAGEDFTLNFKIENNGDNETSQIKVYAEGQSGLVNRSQSAFIEKNILPGQSRTYSIDYFTTEDTDETSYTIKLLVEPVSGEGGGVQQYTAVYVKKMQKDTDSIKNPQLMVDSYSFGGTYVQAGDDFRLDLGLRNTSSYHNLRNIKATLESQDGTFIPSGSSNSFFIDRINKNGYTNQSIYLSTKGDAEQKTTSISVTMTYEDVEGNEFTATDVISIPVMQDTRLMVDDLIAPPELYAGMQTGLSVDFYNMGKTRLNNLRVNAEGNFDTMESNSYFAGNMEPGSTDSYDFSFIPREAGLMEGKVTFTYEDASGDQQVYEKEFAFEIMEMPNWEEEFPADEDMAGEKGKTPWIAIAAGVIVLAAAVFFIIRRIRKKKMQREMEIDE